MKRMYKRMYNGRFVLCLNDWNLTGCDKSSFIPMIKEMQFPKS